MRLFCLFGEPAVIGESHASSKADEQVVHAQQTARASAEESQDKVEYQEALSIDQALPFGKLNGVAAKVSHHHPVEGAEDALVQDGKTHPVENHRPAFEMIPHEIQRQVDERK